MMTTTIYTLLAATLAFFCVSSVTADDGDARVTQTRKVEAFHAIDITTVGDIIFTQDDAYSLRIEGREKYVNNTVTTVSKDGTLSIGFKNKKKNLNRGNNNGVTIYLTAPGLDDIEFKGVGSFRCEETLKLDGDLDIRITGVGEAVIDDLRCRNLDLHMSGVGDAKVTVDCDHVDASMSGVGSVTLRGRAKTADLHRSGIGELNRGGLKVGE
ncbi:DUF2807 domain-containing protein [Bacteroides sp. ET71]|uniref:GIN domain-containing protein n=1 Tax=Bacteroides sp. ET71 TaxID=2939421 RepID=UPI002011F8FA|nr:DUF2807 domain-containing protein [Bacteroides sp. ET71]MCL1617230.1 DUF2807 domain-containing protein [Bacteroides sp. ET71]